MVTTNIELYASQANKSSWPKPVNVAKAQNLAATAAAVVVVVAAAVAVACSCCLFVGNYNSTNSCAK